MTTIDSSYYLKAPGIKTTTETDNGALGKDAFLKILITQLQNQDPTSPMDDKEFIAQMAQFSSLEQMQNMTTAMENLLSSQQQTQMMSYTNFIGKEVKWHEVTDKVDADDKPITTEGTGVITELKFVNGDPIFKLSDGKEISPGNVSSVLGSTSLSSSVPVDPFAAAGEYIGQTVKYYSGETLIEQVVEAIAKNNGVIQYVLGNGERITKNDFVTEEKTDTL
ncbi:MAG: flagellar hook assembly protein FlgD [Solibacillus sp.]